MEKPLRLALWAPCGAGSHYAGAGMTMARMFSLDSGRRFHCDLIHGAKEQKTVSAFRKQIFIADNRIRFGPISYFAFLIASRRWISQYAKDYDGLLTLDAYDRSIYPCIWASKLGVPAVPWVASHRADLADKLGWRRIFGAPGRRRAKLRQLPAVIAISTEIEDELMDYGIPRKKIVRINNFVDVDRYKPIEAGNKQTLRQQLQWPDSFTVIFAGVLGERKSPHLILEAIQSWQGPKLHIVFAGPFENEHYRSLFEGLVVRSKTNTKVTMLGFQKDICTYLQASDIFMLPSKAEGMPGALLEAISCGLPAIVTPFSGAKDAIQHGRSGYIVEKWHVECVQHLALLTDASVRSCFARSARDIATNHFSGESTLEKYHSLFKNLGRMPYV